MLPVGKQDKVELDVVKSDKKNNIELCGFSKFIVTGDKQDFIEL